MDYRPIFFNQRSVNPLATNIRDEGLRILAEGRSATAHGRPVRLTSGGLGGRIQFAPLKSV